MFQIISNNEIGDLPPCLLAKVLKEMRLWQQGFLCVVCLKYRHLRLFPCILQGFLFFLEKLEKIR